MSFIQILDTLRLFGVDVLLLALGVTLLVCLLKKTVMKNASGRVLAVLPFAVGIVLYALFRTLATLSAAPLTTDLAQTLGSGFACGGCATLYGVAYEKLIRGKNVSPLYPLLEGLVPENRRLEAANTLYKESMALPEAERKSYFEEHLNTYCDPPMSEEELSEFAQLLAEFLSSVEMK